MLVDLRLVEQRHKAVLEVLDGLSVTDVARRYGVVRQTVHDWLRRYANEGLGGLVDRSSKPHAVAPVRWVRDFDLRSGMASGLVGLALLAPRKPGCETAPNVAPTLRSPCWTRTACPLAPPPGGTSRRLWRPRPA